MIPLQKKYRSLHLRRVTDFFVMKNYFSTEMRGSNVTLHPVSAINFSTDETVRRVLNLFLNQNARKKLFGLADFVIGVEQAENFRVVKFEFRRNFELFANLKRSRRHERRN